MPDTDASPRKVKNVPQIHPLLGQALNPSPVNIARNRQKSRKDKYMKEYGNAMRK
jgi:hypothetical protein